MSDDLQLTEQAVIFSGNANHALAEKIAHHLGVSLGSATISRFNDGEINIHINESVRGKHVFVIQSTCSNTTESINDNLMELLLLIRTFKRASAGTITVVMPYYGYARQDRKSSPRVPISAADVATMIELAGADRILTVDLHCGQIQGFFRDIPVDNLFAAKTFIPYLIEQNLVNPVVVSPDAGGVERASKFLQSLEKQGISADMALISKQRASAGVIASMNLIGNVQGADAIIVDDICDTAGTLIKAAQLLKDQGAHRVFAVITHAVFSGDAMEKIRNSVIDELIIADTIPAKGDVPSNIAYISVSSLIAQAIYRIHHSESVSELFL
ncbi:ribose-phosphate pyrophosphokinase [Candidatus Babeliales bacterium]|nr:ribose-phosphate pyrophosphokinase [Candidatus Babeliales bacterium]MBP9844371.1 ribose-phosphate pyrophosphokinase [Candidatus Babeliales bacterium]